MILVWTAVLALAWRLSPLPPYGFLAAGALFGALGGTLQCMALSRAGDDLVRAPTALEVRRVLRGTAPGKIYLLVFWGFEVVAVWIPLLRGAHLGPAVIPGPLSAWATFKLVREAITLIPTAKLAKRLRAKGDGPSR